MKKIYLSVVIPAFNEELTIKKGVFEVINNYLKKQDYKWEVVVVDDGSSDTTTELTSRFAESHKGFRLLKEPHRGKGGAVTAGVFAARGEIVLFSDVDQATPLSEVEKFFAYFDEGYEVVIGSRSGRKGAPLVRKVMAYGFSFLRTLILRFPFRDTQCGFKAFKRAAAKKIFKKLKIYSQGTKRAGPAVTAGFDLEILYVARKLGLRIAEVPVEWHDDRVKSELNPLKDSWEGFKDLIRVRTNAFMGKYDV